MNNRPKFVLVIALALSLFTLDAHAGRRSLRVEFQAWEEGQTIPGAECPGTVALSVIVDWNGFTFAGVDDAVYLADTYCQEAFPYDEFAFEDEYLNSLIFPEDEAALASLIGENTDNSVTAIRYSFLDGDRFGEPGGFQWVFYHFPNDTTIVGLYGLVDAVLGSNSYIRQGNTVLWQGDVDGFNGEYFCFRGQEYLGRWPGEQAAGTVLATCAPLILQDGFEEP